MAKALIPLADGFEEIEAVTVIDVLRRGGVEVVTAAIGSELVVKGAHGITVGADALFAAVGDDAYDAIVLPGGGQGTENLKRCEGLIRRLRRQEKDKGLICAICAAPTVLVEAGVIPPGAHITCYPTCQMQLDRAWSPVPAIADENIITGQAPGTAMLFAFVVLRHLCGDRVVGKISREMVTDVLAR